MVPDSPGDALGSHASTVREVLVKVVRSRHGYAADAHLAAHTRSTRGFATQWHDLLVDAQEALSALGFQSHKLAPAGYKIPVVDDCLVYVWRLPGTADAASHFASSPTRKNCFNAPPPDPMLFDPSFMNGSEPLDEAPEEDELVRVVRAVGDKMPLVLVMMQSSPWQLQSIEWAIAELESDGVHLHGKESIWMPEPVVEAEASTVESFDSGAPVAPAVELRKQDGSQPDV